MKNRKSFKFESFATTIWDGKVSKTLILSIVLKNCLFPTNIHNFNQKRRTFLKKGGKKVRKQTNVFFLENRQSENFFPSTFSKLNKGRIEKRGQKFA